MPKNQTDSAGVTTASLADDNATFWPANRLRALLSNAPDGGFACKTTHSEIGYFTKDGAISNMSQIHDKDDGGDYNERPDHKIITHVGQTWRELGRTPVDIYVLCFDAFKPGDIHYTNPTKATAAYIIRKDSAYSVCERDPDAKGNPGPMFCH